MSVLALILLTKMIKLTLPGALNLPLDQVRKLRPVINIYEKADNDIVIAPLGNKPCTIAVAMIAAENENVSVIFDFPTKKSNRTDGVKNTYLFSALVE